MIQMAKKAIYNDGGRKKGGTTQTKLRKEKTREEREEEGEKGTRDLDVMAQEKKMRHSILSSQCSRAQKKKKEEKAKKFPGIQNRGTMDEKGQLGVDHGPL